MGIGSIIQTSNVSMDKSQSIIIDSELVKVPKYIAGTPHAPIFIDGDTNFSDTALAEGWSGDGSEGNPFIIDGLDIDRGGSPGHCISIINTRSNFRISNCNLTGASVNPGAGIYLDNVTYSEITGNLIHNNFNNIFLLRSKSNSLTNNTCYSGVNGIYFFYTSDYNNLTSNYCYDNTIGINLDDGHHNNLINNTCYDSANYGIYFYICSYNNLTKNTFYNNGGYGLLLESSNDNIVTRNAFFDTPTNVMFMSSLPTLDYNYWSEYTGVDDDEDGIGDTLHNVGYPDFHPLMFPPYPPTWNETPTDIMLEFSLSFFYLKLNVSCPYPLTWSINDTMFFLNNEGEITSAILQIGRYDLKVHLGNILYDTELSTSFSVIVIDSTSPVWIISPADQELEYGDEFEYQLAATDIFGIETWQVNDTANFAIDEYGVITNATILNSGVYMIEVQAFDPYDNYCSATINVTVLENDEPTTTTPVATTTTSVTSPTTSASTNQTQSNLDPSLTFIAGIGIGGIGVLIIALIFLSRKT